MDKIRKQAEAHLSKLNDTDLMLGIATTLTELLAKLPLYVKIKVCPDEVTIAELGLEELNKRLNLTKRRKGEVKNEIQNRII